MLFINSCAVILVLRIASYKCESEYFSSNVKQSNALESSRAAVPKFSPEEDGPSHQLKKELLEDVGNESKDTTYQHTRKRPGRTPRNNYDYSMQPHVIVKPSKIKPGQFADKSDKKTKDWDLQDFLKTAVPPTDSKIPWSFWENDDSEFWPDDADDSHPPAEETTSTTTTTTTKAPTMKAAKGPASVHKHYIYFKKAAPWPSPSPTVSLPPEEMMPVEMMQEVIKGMTPDDILMIHPPKKGISGIIQKLKAVDPVTIFVAGVIPASLILAAAIPSVMNQMMNANNGAATMMPPMMTMPMVSTTAMGDTTTMSSRQYDSSDPTSVTDILQAASKFGFQALNNPKCARRMFCRFAQKNLLSKTPEFQRALRIAAIAMQDSWLEALGVRDILQSLSLGTCDERECSDSADIENGTTQPTPV